MSESLLFRPAVKDDLPLILNFIRELAAYEKLSHDVTATEAQLAEMLFGTEPLARVLLAFCAGRPAGFAVYFLQFSTFKAAPVLYLEDLFVKPELRGRGIGKGFFKELAQIAQGQNCCRMQWSVLNWNEPSIRFYESMGARRSDEWLRFELHLPHGRK
jgi:GNAT superfamily N-acetyltransferase